jgi:hypothetical protein
MQVGVQVGVQIGVQIGVQVDKQTARQLSQLLNRLKHIVMRWLCTLICGCTTCYHLRLLQLCLLLHVVADCCGWLMMWLVDNADVWAVRHLQDVRSLQCVCGRCAGCVKSAPTSRSEQRRALPKPTPRCDEM